MNGKAMFAGCIAGILGSAAWGGIAIGTGYEIGWLAWAIGGLIGMAIVYFEGKGSGMAWISAGLALASIFGGKMVAVRHFVNEAVSGDLSSFITVQEYDEYKAEAGRFSELNDESKWPEFMIAEEYSDASSPQAVTQAEIADFRAENVPRLKAFHANPPAFEAWRAEIQQRMQAVSAEISLFSPLIFSAAVDSLGIMDIIFAFLGLGTAFKVVARQDEGK